MNAEDVKKEQYKIMKIYIIAVLCAFLCSSFCFFIGYMYIPLGILLGGIFGLLSHFLLFTFSGEIFSYGRRARVKAFFYYMVRYLLFGFGLFICLLLSYFSYHIFFWGSYVVTYFAHNLILIFYMYFHK